MDANQNIAKENNTIVSILKGVLIGLCVSVVGICIFAFFLRFIDISDGVIKPVNMAIKILSIFWGTLFGLKNHKDMGLVKGMLIGLLYSLLSFLIFSLLCGSFNFSVTLLNDAMFGGGIGAICGVVFVNLKK